MCILFVGLDDRINKSKYENILGLKKVNVVIRNALVVSVNHGAMVCMCTMLPDVANFFHPIFVKLAIKPHFHELY